MQTITVKASTSYPIYIENGLLQDCGALIAKLTTARRVCIVSDNIVDALYADKAVNSLRNAGFDVEKFVFTNGEEQKSATTLFGIYDFLSTHSFTRSDLLIALGGGVVGDITGFCAATYLRGVDFVQIPTTLLAQIDSSVGGKTGINIESGKNLVGAFKQPIGVICDPEVLSTLPPQIFSDGIAEAVKYGMIHSAALFDKLNSDNVKDQLLDIITQCITIKRDIVERDEFDTGERMLLNFGHTVGHALERHYNYIGISHGQAVAAGMCIITKLAQGYGMCAQGLYDRLVECLERYNLPTSTDVEYSSLLEHCLHDKKRSGDMLNIILCKDVGDGNVVKLTVSEFEKFLFGRFSSQ